MNALEYWNAAAQQERASGFPFDWKDIAHKIASACVAEQEQERKQHADAIAAQAKTIAEQLLTIEELKSRLPADGAEDTE